MKDSHIQWTDNTFNPWEGCTKVSPGCLNCYAETRNARFGGGTAPNWGPGAPRRRTSESNWNEPKRWNRKAQEQFEAHNREVAGSFGHLSEMMEEPIKPRVFCASLADWLDDEVEISWLADLLILVFDCGFLDWQMLTKRPENWANRIRIAAAWIRNHKEPSERNAAIVAWLEAWLDGVAPHNVWFGTTVEDQARADERIPILLEIPAVVRFLSCEPLLERVTLPLLPIGVAKNAAAKGEVVEVELRPLDSFPRVSWVIVGGESGKGCRPTNVDAIENVVFQCREAKVACFVKQLGAKPFSLGINGVPTLNSDNRLHLKHPKGGDPDEWSERFRVQQFPNEEAVA